MEKIGRSGRVRPEGKNISAQVSVEMYEHLLAISDRLSEGSGEMVSVSELIRRALYQVYGEKKTGEANE